MSDILALAPYVGILVFLLCVVFPVVMAGGRIRFSRWATLFWTLVTLAWLPAAGVVYVILPEGARAMTGVLACFAAFSLCGIILIMVVAWRLNAVGKTRWLAVLTPLLPFSLALIAWILRLPDVDAASQRKAKQPKAEKRRKSAPDSTHTDARAAVSPPPVPRQHSGLQQGLQPARQMPPGAPPPLPPAQHPAQRPAQHSVPPQYPQRPQQPPQHSAPARPGQQHGAPQQPAPQGRPAYPGPSSGNPPPPLPRRGPR